MSYCFTSKGWKTVRVTVSDNLNATSLVTQSGNPLPFALISLYVHPSPGLRFAVWAQSSDLPASPLSFLTIKPQETITLSLRVCDPHICSPSTLSLTSEYASLGESPVVTAEPAGLLEIKALTSEGNLDTTRTAWPFSIKPLANSTSGTVRIRGGGIGASGTGLAESVIEFAIVRYAEDWEESDLELAALATQCFDAGMQPESFIVRHSPCSPASLIALPRFDNVSRVPYAGGLVVMTDDHFSVPSLTSHWTNILRPSLFASDPSALAPNTSACTGLATSECASVTVLDAYVGCRHTLFLTSRGLVSTPAAAANKLLKGAVPLFTVHAQTTIPAVDSRAALPPDSLFLRGPGMCYKQASSECVLLVQRGNTSSHAAVNCAPHHDGMWRPIPIVHHATGSPPTSSAPLASPPLQSIELYPHEVIWDAAMLYETSSLLFLIGQATNATQSRLVVYAFNNTHDQFTCMQSAHPCEGHVSRIHVFDPQRSLDRLRVFPTGELTLVQGDVIYQISAETATLIALTDSVGQSVFGLGMEDTAQGKVPGLEYGAHRIIDAAFSFKDGGASHVALLTSHARVFLGHHAMLDHAELPSPFAYRARAVWASGAPVPHLASVDTSSPYATTIGSLSFSSTGALHAWRLSLPPHGAMSPSAPFPQGIYSARNAFASPPFDSLVVPLAETLHAHEEQLSGAQQMCGIAPSQSHGEATLVPFCRALSAAGSYAPGYARVPTGGPLGNPRGGPSAAHMGWWFEVGPRTSPETEEAQAPSFPMGVTGGIITQVASSAAPEARTAALKISGDPLTGALATSSAAECPVVSASLLVFPAAPSTNLSLGASVWVCIAASTDPPACLSTATPGGPQWRADYLARTLYVRDEYHMVAPVLLQEWGNATFIRGTLLHLHSAAATTLWVSAAGKWSLFDSRPFADEAAALDTQRLQVTGPVPGAAFNATPSLAPLSTTRLATLTGHSASGAMSFASRHTELLLQVETGSGLRTARIAAVLNASHAALIPYNSTNWPASTQEYTPGRWHIFSPAPGFTMYPFPSEHRLRGWRVIAPPCPLHNVEATCSWTTLDILDTTQLCFTMQPPGVPVVSLTNPLVFALNVTPVVASGQSTYSRHALALQGRRIQGAGSLIVRPHYHAIRCLRGTVATGLWARCPPTKVVRIALPFTTQEFLNGNPLGSDGIALVETLVVNYRPPSRLGNGIPTTQNMYHADPSQPRYNDFTQRSKTTGSYKQCPAGQPRTACKCSTEQTISQFVKDSDCITRSYRRYFGAAYAPQLEIVEEGKATVHLTDKYRLTELNNRTDYCYNATGVNCIAHTNITQFLLDPTKYDALTFTGAGLYHFRAEVVGESYCSLSTEFHIWVYRPGIPATVVWSIVSISAVTMAIALFIIYLLHYKLRGRRFS